MLKTISCLGSATLGVLLLSACGSTSPVSIDKSVLSTGEDNSMASGGYFWTYTDHNKQMKSPNAGATITPITGMDTPLVPEADDAAHGKVLHFSGSIPPAPVWGDVLAMGEAGGPNWSDTYWKTIYPDALIAGYPAAGAGFGFGKNNKPYDAVQGKYIGFIFDMKTAGGTNDIYVSVPIVGTDLADKNFLDDFPANGCVYPNNPTPGTGDAAAFASTYSKQSCFRNYRKTFTIAERSADGAWGTYCVLWSELAPPSWGADATPPAINKDTLKQALKVQWDMYQPATGTAAAPFDVKLDNIKLVTEEDAKKVTGCGADAIAASTTLIAP